MKELIRLVKSDFLKLKNTWFYTMHIVLPIVGLSMFLAYYCVSPWESHAKVLTYVQTLALAFPIIISIVSAIVVEQERKAGNFNMMLTCASYKFKALFSKAIVLLSSCLFSIIIAIGGFAVGFKYICNQTPVGIDFYINIIALVFVSQIFMYLLHLLISFVWGSGATLGIGVFESLCSGLLITSLGNGIWQWIPSAWAIKLSKIYMLIYIDKSHSLLVGSSKAGIINMVVFTVLLAGLMIVWFGRFEGSKENI